jgi:hypothetical protein
VYVVFQYPFVGLKFQNAFNFIFFVHCRHVFGETGGYKGADEANLQAFLEEMKKVQGVIFL